MDEKVSDLRNSILSSYIVDMDEVERFIKGGGDLLEGERTLYDNVLHAVLVCEHYTKESKYYHHVHDGANHYNWRILDDHYGFNSLSCQDFCCNLAAKFSSNPFDEDSEDRNRRLQRVIFAISKHYEDCNISVEEVIIEDHNNVRREYDCLWRRIKTFDAEQIRESHRRLGECIEKLLEHKLFHKVKELYE